MRQLRQSIAVVVLTAALALTANAGIMETGVSAPQPPPSSSTSSTSNGTTEPPVNCGIMETGVTCGDSSEDQDGDSLLLTLLAAVQGVLATL